MNSRRNILIALVALLWLTITISLYYVLHKPFSPAMALSFGRAAGQMLVAGGVISIAGGLGAWIYPCESQHPLVRLALQAALGLGILSIAVLLVGAVIGLNLLWMWLLFLASGVIVRRFFLVWWKDWRTLSSILAEASLIDGAIAVIVGLILLATLATALAPPLKFDALVYHLRLPQAYLEAGGIVYLPGLMYWGMPQTTEMLYTWAMALAGTEAAVLIGWMVGCLTIVGILGFVSQKLKVRSAWVSIAALMAGYTTASSLAWGYVEWMTILYGWAFLIALDRWVAEHDRKSLILAAVFAGFALGAKYTAGVLSVIGLIMIAWSGRKNQPGKLLQNLSIFGVVVFLVSSPWWVKNLVSSGNPFYPLLFPSGAMDPMRLDFYQGQVVWAGWRELILLPVQATLQGVEGTPGFSASIGPLLLALGACSYVGFRQRSEDQRSTLKVAAIVALSGLTIWAGISRFSGFLIQTRFYFSLFPAFAFLAGMGYDGLSRISVPRVRLGRVVAWLVTLVLGLNLIKVGNTVLRQNNHNYLLANISKDEYLLNNLGWYAWVMESIAKLPAESRVLMLWEPRSFYCAPKCIPDEILDRWIHEARQRGEVERILGSWRDEGFTHLLYYRQGAEFIQRDDNRYLDTDWQLLDALLGELSDPLEFGDVYALYALKTP